MTPRASRDALAVDGDRLVVRVKAPPVDGKANAAVERVLAKALGVARSRVAVVRGASAREKVVRVEGLSVAEVVERLGA